MKIECLSCAKGMELVGELVIEQKASSVDGSVKGQTGKARIICLNCGASGMMDFCSLMTRHKKRYRRKDTGRLKEHLV